MILDRRFFGFTGRKPSRAFNPAVLFTGGVLGAWYDPSDLSTMFQDTAGATPVTAAGQSVARINDKSGNGLNLIQATGTKCPTYQLDGNGKPALLLDGVDDFLTNASSIAGNNQSIVAAVAATAATAVGLWNAAAVNDRIAIAAGTGAGTFTARYSDGTTVTGKNKGGSALPNVLTAEVNKAAPSVGLRANAVDAVATTGTGPGSTVGLFLGSPNGVASFFAGYFYGLVQVARALTTVERASLETYLGAKCGVVL